jgi:hypothetical protein
MRDLFDLGKLDIKALPRANTARRMCVGGLLGICPFTDSTCSYNLVPEADVEGEFARQVIKVARPVLE